MIRHDSAKLLAMMQFIVTDFPFYEAHSHSKMSGLEYCRNAF